jgi:hypothetical protein
VPKPPFDIGINIPGNLRIIHPDRDLQIVISQYRNGLTFFTQACVVTKPVAGNTDVIVRSVGWDSVMEALYDILQTTMNQVDEKLGDDRTPVF